MFHIFHICVRVNTQVCVGGWEIVCVGVWVCGDVFSFKTSVFIFCRVHNDNTPPFPSYFQIKMEMLSSWILYNILSNINVR